MSFWDTDFFIPFLEIWGAYNCSEGSEMPCGKENCFNSISKLKSPWDPYFQVKSINIPWDEYCALL